MGAAVVSIVYNRSSKFDMTGSSLDEKRKRARTTLRNLGFERSSLGDGVIQPRATARLCAHLFFR
jgi:hypothetical protein